MATINPFPADANKAERTELLFRSAGNFDGATFARAVFDRRGNHSEAHINERELAALLAEAFYRGVVWRQSLVTKETK